MYTRRPGTCRIFSDIYTYVQKRFSVRFFDVQSQVPFVVIVAYYTVDAVINILPILTNSEEDVSNTRRNNFYASLLSEGKRTGGAPFNVPHCRG